MAIPNNYIDKITDKDSDESRPICPPAEHVQVDNENFEGDTLDEVLGEVARAIEGAAPDNQMSGTSENAVQNRVIKAYVDAVSQRIDTLIGSGNVQGAIDTFNEVVAFLNGINSSDTLAAKLLLKQDALVAGNGIVIGNDGKTVSVDAEVVEPATADGTFAIRIGGNTYTINLNHEHPQYQPLLTAGSNITITTDPQTGEVTISAAGGGGGSITIDPSITGANQANPVAGGAIYTALQAKANANEMDIVDVSNDTTRKNIQLKSGLSATVVTQHQSLAGRVRSTDVVSIVKISQAAYDALQVKDSSTLYLITES